MDLCLLFHLHDDCGCWHTVLVQRNREEYTDTDTCFGVEVCGGRDLGCWATVIDRKRLCTKGRGLQVQMGLENERIL